MCVVPVSILYRYLFNICQNIINWSGFFHTSFFLSPRCYTKLGYAMTRRILYQYQWGERNMFNCGDKHYINFSQSFMKSHLLWSIPLRFSYASPLETSIPVDSCDAPGADRWFLHPCTTLGPFLDDIFRVFTLQIFVD